MNRLQHEQSPYLVHHAENPVDWYPWGEEAFIRAKTENKPIFLSIGYSTCHWCHVMARESFENDEIAQILNQHFVSVKVDREERPDIDQVYMASVTAMTGQGGWPLSVFLTPDQKPFYGGTYFPPVARWGSVGFRDLLGAIHQSWQKDPDKVIASSVELTELLRRRFSVEPDEKTVSMVQLDEMFNRLKSQFDTVNGGFGQAPKFPMGHTLSLLLRYGSRTGHQEALHMVTQTLSCMAHGGIYDQMGGGFHRYSTDQFWHLPHFEKMLYDQALLVHPYIEAFQVTGERYFADVARDILDYVLREMTDTKGGFYSAQDADSIDIREGQQKEGAFYVWSLQEMIDVLGQQEAEVVAYHFGVAAAGNVAHDPHCELTSKNVLSIAHSLADTARHFNRDTAEIKSVIDSSKKKLFEARKQRPHPYLDDKIMTDCNGLMISAFAHASVAFDDERYTRAARRAADFILQSLVSPEGRLLHRYRNGESGILGTLEDHAFFILGLLDLYEATFELKYFERARALTDAMIDLFGDPKSGGFYLTGHDAPMLIVRTKEIYDGAVPSGNSAAALVLTRLYHMTGVKSYHERFEELIRVFAGAVGRFPEAHSFLLSAFVFDQGPVDEIVLSGPHEHPEFVNMKQVIFQTFRPSKVVAANPGEESPMPDAARVIPLLAGRLPDGKSPVRAYVCRDHKCLLPSETAAELQRQLQQTKFVPKVMT